MYDYPPQQPRMQIAPAFSKAVEHAKFMLFQPFDITVWLSIGFMVFLESLGQGGGGLNFRSGGSGGGNGGNWNGDVSQNVQEIQGWLAGHLGLVVIVGTLAVLVALGLMVLFVWLGSRGQMMLIRAVVYNYAGIGDNWRAVREIAHSLFLFRLALFGIGFLVILSLLGIGAAVAAAVAASAPEGGWPFVIALSPVVLSVVLLGLALWLINTLLRNFVAPLMFRFQVGTREGWRLFREISRDNLGVIAVFLILRFAYHVPLALAQIFVACVTCCIGALPVIQQTIFAPFYVFDRAFSLFLLQGLGPEYDMMQPETPVTETPNYPPPA